MTCLNSFSGILFSYVYKPRYSVLDHCIYYVPKALHENSVGLSSATNPKPKGQPSISLPVQANLTQQKAEHAKRNNLHLDMWLELCYMYVTSHTNWTVEGNKLP